MTKIGTIVDGKYEILKEIGRGGMSIVYLAMDNRLNKQWAVKEIKKEISDRNNEIIVQSLLAEANLMKRLDHPALPRIVDIIDNGITIYIVMDYIEGESLNKVLAEYGAQPQEFVIDWAKQLAEVLDYLHTRVPPIIYRDMKPGNVMLCPDGNLKLVDFGIAREFKEQNLADTVVLGTKGYAAPEQFGGKGQTDARTDIYCLGATLYHLITGQSPCEPPYELYPIRQWNPTLSAGLERIILKCTQLNPDDRYQSCVELLYALQHYEELDDVFRKKQKGKLFKFVAMVAASLLFVLLGSISQIAKNADENRVYSENKKLAGNSGATHEQRENAFSTAIGLKKNPEIYKSLVDFIQEDGYSIGELDTYSSGLLSPLIDEQFVEDMNDAEEQDYAELVFRIGKLYFTATNTPGETNLGGFLGAKNSKQWFDAYLNMYENKDENKVELAESFRTLSEFQLYLKKNSDQKGLNNNAINEDKPFDIDGIWKGIDKLTEFTADNINKTETQVECLRMNLVTLSLLSNNWALQAFHGEKSISYSDIKGTIEAIIRTSNVDPYTKNAEELKKEIVGEQGLKAKIKVYEHYEQNKE